MSMAKLSIWVSEEEDPCGLTNRTWYVTIYDCDGNVLQWCGKRFLLLRAPCGHLEVEVPPGCYYIKAVWGFTPIVLGRAYRVNHFTDAAIVQACCGETTCVKLFNPTAHRCGIIFLRAVRDLLRQKLIKAETARNVTQAVEELLGQLPRPVKEFELGHLAEIDKLVEERAAEEKGDEREQA